MAGWKKILKNQISPNPPRLTIEDAVILYDESDLNDLMDAALFRRRKQVPGNRITYLVDRNINYTNVCTINCQFCSFYRPPGHSETYTQTFKQISARISELEQIGGSRILMQGGVNPDLELDWYLDLIKNLRQNHPSIDLDCFSPIEIEGIAEVCNLTTFSVLEKMKKADIKGSIVNNQELSAMIGTEYILDNATDISQKDTKTSIIETLESAKPELIPLLNELFTEIQTEMKEEL